MKIPFTLILLAFTLLGRTQADVTPKVVDCLKRGDATLLATFFMPQVELSIMDQDDVYTPKEAEELLKKFFVKNPVKDFVLKHQGTSKLDDQYRIGELITSKGNYRVTFFMKKSTSSLLIKQLKIEAPGGDE
jgi:hypothetical protein